MLRITLRLCPITNWSEKLRARIARHARRWRQCHFRRVNCEMQSQDCESKSCWPLRDDAGRPSGDTRNAGSSSPDPESSAELLRPGLAQGPRCNAQQLRHLVRSIGARPSLESCGCSRRTSGKAPGRRRSGPRALRCATQPLRARNARPRATPALCISLGPLTPGAEARHRQSQRVVPPVPGAAALAEVVVTCGDKCPTAIALVSLRRPRDAGRQGPLHTRPLPHPRAPQPPP